MKVQIRHLTPAQWADISEMAHKVVFEKKKEASFDRIDYALMAVDEEGGCLGYLTARDLNRENVYWQFGGAFPSVRGTASSWTTFQAALEWTKSQGYKRISMYIENTNAVFLKFALKAGFLITGLKTVGQQILLEHALEL
jgi:RimJ/RimL family protein N-acetyltransferase